MAAVGEGGVYSYYPILLHVLSYGPVEGPDFLLFLYHRPSHLTLPHPGTRRSSALWPWGCAPG
jgi:hypothetical protein